MRAYGSDRVRKAGERWILHSPIPKGWTPRKGRFPGTAVLCDEEYFEVVSAEGLQSGGVRYELAAWQDENVFRVFEHYDEANEQRRADDHRIAARQRRYSVLARLSGMLLGHLPMEAQQRVANELGLFPARMTLLSTIPPVVLLGVCVYFHADAIMQERLSPVPLWLWLVALFLFADAAVRFFVAMSQNRGMGSLPGTLLYALFARRKPAPRLAPPTAPADVAMHDALLLRAPFLTLLRADEQRRLAERYAFDYRQHAFGIAVGLLLAAALGIVVSVIRYSDTGRATALLSAVVASAVFLEQAVRLVALRRGPVGSMFAIVVRPFVRELLESR